MVQSGTTIVLATRSDRSMQAGTTVVLATRSDRSVQTKAIRVHSADRSV